MNRTVSNKVTCPELANTIPAAPSARIDPVSKDDLAVRSLSGPTLSSSYAAMHINDGMVSFDANNPHHNPFAVYEVRSNRLAGLKGTIPKEKSTERTEAVPSQAPATSAPTTMSSFEERMNTPSVTVGSLRVRPQVPASKTHADFSQLLLPPCPRPSTRTDDSLPSPSYSDAVFEAAAAAAVTAVVTYGGDERALSPPAASPFLRPVKTVPHCLSNGRPLAVPTSTRSPSHSTAAALADAQECDEFFETQMPGYGKLIVDSREKMIKSAAAAATTSLLNLTVMTAATQRAIKKAIKISSLIDSTHSAYATTKLNMYTAIVATSKVAAAVVAEVGEVRARDLKDLSVVSTMSDTDVPSPASDAMSQPSGVSSPVALNKRLRRDHNSVSEPSSSDEGDGGSIFGVPAAIPASTSTTAANAAFSNREAFVSSIKTVRQKLMETKAALISEFYKVLESDSAATALMTAPTVSPRKMARAYEYEDDHFYGGPKRACYSPASRDLARPRSLLSSSSGSSWGLLPPPQAQPHLLARCDKLDPSTNFHPKGPQGGTTSFDSLTRPTVGAYKGPPSMKLISANLSNTPLHSTTVPLANGGPISMPSGTLAQFFPTGHQPDSYAPGGHAAGGHTTSLLVPGVMSDSMSGANLFALTGLGTGLPHSQDPNDGPEHDLPGHGYGTVQSRARGHGHQDRGHPGHGHQGHAHQGHAHQGHAHQDHGHQDHGHQDRGHHGHGHHGHGHHDHGHSHHSRGYVRNQEQSHGQARGQEHRLDHAQEPASDYHRPVTPMDSPLAPPVVSEPILEASYAHPRTPSRPSQRTTRTAAQTSPTVQPRAEPRPAPAAPFSYDGPVNPFTLGTVRQQNTSTTRSASGRTSRAVQQGSRSPPAPQTARKRTNFSPEVIAVLQGWMDNNWEEPYPSTEEKIELAKQTGLSVEQISHWYINTRMRRWRKGVSQKYDGAVRKGVKVPSLHVLARMKRMERDEEDDDDDDEEEEQKDIDSRESRRPVNRQPPRGGGGGDKGRASRV